MIIPAPIFDWRAGSNLDRISGTAGTNSGVPYVESEKGLAGEFDGGSGDYITHAVSDFGSEFTVISWVKVEAPPSGVDYMWELGLNRVAYDSVGALIIYYDGGAQVASGFLDSEWMFVESYYLEDGNGLTSKFWINGVLKKEFTDAGGSLSSYTDLRIGWGAKGYHNRCIVYDHELTTEERNQLYSEFVNATNLAQTKTNFYYPKPVDLSLEVATHRGSEVVTNGGFDTDTNWLMAGAEAANITISGGVMNFTITDGSFAYQSGALIIPGTKHEMTIDVTLESGLIQYYLGALTRNSITESGSYTFECTPTASDSTVYLQGDSAVGFVGTVDNVSVKPIQGLQAAYNFAPIAGLTDISGNGNTATNYGATSTYKSYSFDGVDDYVSGNPNVDITGDFTVCMRFKPKDVSTEQIFFASLFASSNRFTIQLHSNQMKVSMYDGAYTSVSEALTVANKWYNLTIINSSGVLAGYLDGVLMTGTTDVNHISTGTAIGYNGDGNWYYNGEIEEVRQYNLAWTEDQAVAWHNSFAKQINYHNTFKWEAVGNVPEGFHVIDGEIEIREHSSITTGELIINGDFEGGFTAGVGNGWTAYGTGVTYSEDTTTSPNGSSQKAEFTQAAAVYQAVDFYAGHTYRVQGIYRADEAYVNTGIIVRTSGYAFVTTLVNSVAGGADTWIDFDILYTPATDNINGQIGLDNRTAHTITTWLDDFSVTEYNPLEIQNGDKYMYCTTDNTRISFPSDQVAGTWEVDLNKEEDGNSLIWVFINPDIEPGDGRYRLNLYSDEAIELRRNSATLWDTSPAYFTINTWYRFKITRDDSGEFTTWIKGGEFGSDYVLINPAVAGTNPVTNSQYWTSAFVVFDINEGCQIGRIIHYKGIEQ